VCNFFSWSKKQVKLLSFFGPVHVIKIADPKGLKQEVMLETGGLGADIIIDKMVSFREN